MSSDPHPLFEIVTTTAGAVSIRHKIVNEIMHNPVGPWVEANALYVDQSNMRERLAQKASGPFVVFDVGLGAAANAVATLACARAIKSPRRSLKLISFEIEMELLRFTIKNSVRFPHLRGFEEAMQNLLKTGEWQEDGIHWQLRQGDFVNTLTQESEKPHLILFDPYSPEVNQNMWTTSLFRQLRNGSRSPEEEGTLLLTYSQATRIRAALIEAGFFVGYGDQTGLKSETTVAATDLRLLKNPLGEKWLGRWQRSHLKFPFDCAPEHELEHLKIVENYFSVFSTGF